MHLIGTVRDRACDARAGCWVQACGLQCLFPVHTTHDAGIVLVCGNRLKVIFHRICTLCACSTCVYTLAFNKHSAIHVLSTCLRRRFCCRETWHLVEYVARIRYCGWTELHQCCEKLSATGKVICMYLILWWQATMHQLYMYNGRGQRNSFSYSDKTFSIRINLERVFLNKLILILNLPNYKWVSMRHICWWTELLLLLFISCFGGGGCFVAAYSPRARLKATQGTDLQYKIEKLKCKIKHSEELKVWIEIQKLKI